MKNLTKSKNQLPLELPEIIVRPDLQSRLHRGFFGLLSLIGWLIWLYLLLPLASLVAWWFGWHLFDTYIQLDSAQFIRSMLIINLIVFLLGSLLLLWALYNLIRFRGKERRAFIPPVTTPEIASLYALNATDVAQPQQFKITYVSFDDQGHFTRLEDHPPLDAG